MPALRQRSPIDMPAALALASTSPGVSSPLDIRKSYLQECAPVKSILANRHDHGERAQIGPAVDRKLIRQFVLDAAEAAETDITGLARRANLAPSTLLRFVNGEEKYLLTWRTLAKVAQASGVPIPSTIAAPSERERVITNLSAEMSRVEGLVRGLKDAQEAISELSKAALGHRDFGHSLAEGELQEWLENLSKVPSVERNHLLEVVRGMAKASALRENEAEPRKASGTVKSGERRAETLKG